ncbi:hypothetical protein MSG28_014476 [Choristoneura fumiferana]|uniref:Uncharacterized protein n=1 Tax=Choristoneura fumiferana TaxID=7141 RepID=A0ACC0JRK1_CHOFU|nr:hypothetical protein MSG28_014476 [Choristoneura fumiferana]
MVRGTGRGGRGMPGRGGMGRPPFNRPRVLLLRPPFDLVMAETRVPEMQTRSGRYCSHTANHSSAGERYGGGRYAPPFVLGLRWPCVCVRRSLVVTRQLTLGTGEHASEQSDSDNNTDPPPQPLNLSSTLGTGEHASEQSDSDNNTDPPPQFQNFSRNLSPSTPSSTPSLQIELDHDSNEEVVRGKRINYSLRGSYESRCYAAATKRNTGSLVATMSKVLTKNEELGTYTQKYEKRQAEKAKRKSSQDKKSKRRKRIAGPDEHYGDIEKEPDMEVEHYEKRKQALLADFSKSKIELENIQKDTVGQATNPEWIKQRKIRLTASVFGQICKRRAATSCKNIIKTLLYSNFKGSDATRYGNENEPIALKETEAALGVQVSPCGLYILEEHQYLGASPDGVIDEETIVEIKCPASAANMTPTEAILKKKITFCVLDESDPQKIKLKQNHNYFYQALLKRHTELCPTPAEQSAVLSLVTKLQTVLDNLVVAPGDFAACQLEEVRQVGSYKKGTMMAGKNIADIVVIMKTLPTKEAVEGLSNKVTEELNKLMAAEGVAGVACACHERGFTVQGSAAAVRVLVTTLHHNLRKLEPEVHLEYKVISSHLAAIRHSRWFEENAHHSSIKVLIRLLRDMCARHSGLEPLTPWMIDLLAHHCIMNNPQRQALPIAAAFRRALSLVAGGLFLPGCAGLADPCEAAHARAHTALDLAAQDNAAATAQTLLRVVARGGHRYVLGLQAFEGGKDISGEITVWDGVVVSPLAPAYSDAPEPMDTDDKDDDGQDGVAA